MASPAPASKVFLDVDLTIISAKHLKNVNWRHGDLKPYAIACFDPNCAFPTKVDTSGGTKPVWNERFSFTLAIPLPLHLSFLTFNVLHSDGAADPLVVGSVRFPLSDALADSASLFTLNLLRPSGRPQGQMKLKIAIRERRIPVNDPSTTTVTYYPPPASPLPPCRFPSMPAQLHWTDSRDQSIAGYVSSGQDGFGGKFIHTELIFSSSPLPPLPPILTRRFGGFQEGPSAPFAESPSSASRVDCGGSFQKRQGAQLRPEVYTGASLKQEIQYGDREMRTEHVESASPSRHQ